MTPFLFYAPSAQILLFLPSSWVAYYQAKLSRMKMGDCKSSDGRRLYSCSLSSTLPQTSWKRTRGYSLS